MEDSLVVPQALNYKGFVTKIEGGRLWSRLAYFFFFAFSGFCAAHFSIIWKKTEASSGW